MPIRRGYALALCLAVGAVGGYYLTRRGASGDNALQNIAHQVQLARQGLPAARRALQQMTIPGAVRLTTGCRFWRCYVVHAAPSQVAHALPRILRGVGGRPDNTPLLFAALIQGAQQTGVRGCQVMRSLHHGPFTSCVYSGTLDHNNVDLFLQPYVPCRLGRCQWTAAAEIDISIA